MFMFGNVFMSTNLDLCKNRKFCSVPGPLQCRLESITFIKTLSNLFVPKHYCLPFHSRFVRFTVSLLFFIFRCFPRSSSLVRFSQFPSSFFASRHKLFCCGNFQLVRFPLFFSIISFLLFQTLLVAEKKLIIEIARGR